MVGYREGCVLNESVTRESRAPDPVVDVRHPVLALEKPGALQLDLLGGQVVKQAPPLAEEHGDDVELELVEDARGQRELGDRGAMHEDVLPVRALLGAGHGGRDVVHIGDQRPRADVDAGLPAAVDEDRDAVVVVAFPASSGLERPPPGDYSTGGHRFIEDLAVDPARSPESLEAVVAWTPSTLEDPFV